MKCQCWGEGIPCLVFSPEHVIMKIIKWGNDSSNTHLLGRWLVVGAADD